ncbi:5-(carboxyamino)imidazole ribonucleotide synthase [Planctomicrobium piriforme]|uniref:N5-carboxyaminoimidazole ribonucleotide synthase n=1 Tax=Planctomicrobium piriforme TaxID=1576369 RepID=A0A1I3RNV2_9PLAN|nr:5-(carboxyamino)imidazole ribonucleotide synthase [Planctomicrobium piriforme]SFJ48254.1 5-(carboxyamino)imidazole ribonucleotide synthase [Planctomicrobium piriforme]
MTQPILPGATIGILGSGQLGRMLAVAARRLGYGVQVFSPDLNSPAGQVADREWGAKYDDVDRLKEFVRRVDVVTLEFENVPVETLNVLEKFVPVRPGPRVLEAAQNRLREKTTLRGFGLPTADFLAIHSLDELRGGLAQFGQRGILKTANWGYDGKGQQFITGKTQLPEVWKSFAGQEAILEAVVDFECELSVIAARNPQGDICSYDPILNQHRHHILDVSISPVPQFSAATIASAKEIARTVMESLDVCGVLCVELFLTKSGDLLINEIAPRPHNSGHLTLDAHACSQFEQQLRGICGLPLGSTEQYQPAAMANLLGDLWQGDQPPRWEAALQASDVRLHLYGKPEARPGRKMGHLTCLAADAATAERRVREVREQLLG